MNRLAGTSRTQTVDSARQADRHHTADTRAGTEGTVADTRAEGTVAGLVGCTAGWIHGR